MTNEAKSEGGATTALPVEGEIVEPLSAKASAPGGMRPYSPPRLRSLGKVAELTFLKSRAGTDGGAAKKHTG